MCRSRQVLDVARWIRDELEALGVFALPKTSGASGLHIFMPLAPGTPYEAGLLFCQIVATMVAEKHPKVATVERVGARARAARLRGLPAEHRGQDARVRLQRARQRVRRRLDAAHVEGSGRGRPAGGLHDQHGAGAAAKRWAISGSRSALRVVRTCMPSRTAAACELQRHEPTAHAMQPVVATDVRPVTGYQDFVDTAPLDLIYVAELFQANQPHGPSG